VMREAYRYMCRSVVSLARGPVVERPFA